MVRNIKLIKYYWSLCQVPNLNSFRLNVIVLSSILVRSFSMKINPESFQILTDEIVNSSMFKSRDFTKKRLKIPKGQSESVYRRTDNTMSKRKNNDRQNLHMKLKFE